MKIFKIILSILGISFGIFFFVYGGYDDSPGGQVIGLLLAILGIWGIIKSRKKLPIKEKADFS